MPPGRQPVTLETSSSLVPPSAGESRISMLPVAAIDCQRPERARHPQHFAQYPVHHFHMPHAAAGGKFFAKTSHRFFFKYSDCPELPEKVCWELHRSPS